MIGLLRIGDMCSIVVERPCRLPRIGSGSFWVAVFRPRAAYAGRQVYRHHSVLTPLFVIRCNAKSTEAVRSRPGLRMARLNLLQIVAPYSQLAVLIISLLAFLSFFGAMHGGTIVEVSLRELHRWRGPFIPLWTQRISFESIRKVQIGPGIHPGSAQAARRRDHSYHVAIVSSGGPVIVRWTNSRDDAKHYASLIARVVGCPAEEHFD